MTDRRSSSRSRKAIDYSSLENNDDFQDDDDFASTLAPPTKKTKTEPVKKTQGEMPKLKKENKEQSKAATTKTRKAEERLPLDEKLLERDLQIALKLSKESLNMPSLAPDTSNTTVTLTALTNIGNSESLQNGHVIDLSADNDASSTFNPSHEADSDCLTSDDDASSEDDGSDENFSSASEQAKKTKSSSTRRGKTSDKLVGASGDKSSRARQSASSTTNQCPVTKAVWAPVRLPVSVRSPIATSKSLKVAPSVGGLGSMTSPSSGLRLGLSRNVRVKPLHPQKHN